MPTVTKMTWTSRNCFLNNDARLSRKRKEGTSSGKKKTLGREEACSKEPPVLPHVAFRDQAFRVLPGAKLEHETTGIKYMYEHC